MKVRRVPLVWILGSPGMLNAAAPTTPRAAAQPCGAAVPSSRALTAPRSCSALCAAAGLYICAVLRGAQAQGPVPLAGQGAPRAKRQVPRHQRCDARHGAPNSACRGPGMRVGRASWAQAVRISAASALLMLHAALGPSTRMVHVPPHLTPPPLHCSAHAGGAEAERQPPERLPPRPVLRQVRHCLLACLGMCGPVHGAC